MVRFGVPNAHKAGLIGLIFIGTQIVLSVCHFYLYIYMEAIMSEIKALSFDMYRTLIDTKDFHEQAVRDILKQEGAGSIDPDIFHKKWDDYYDVIHEELGPDEFMLEGEVATESLRKAFREYGIDGDAEAGFSTWMNKYERSELYPEVEEVFAALAKKYPIIVVSNVDNQDLGYAMFRSKNLPVIDIITSETYRSYKPHGKLFEVALSILKCQPHEVLHIGDSQRSDVYGAQMAGMKGVWLNRRSEKLKAGISPDYVITDLRELLELDI